MKKEFGFLKLDQNSIFHLTIVAKDQKEI